MDLTPSFSEEVQAVWGVVGAGRDWGEGLGGGGAAVSK